MALTVKTSHGRSISASGLFEAPKKEPESDNKGNEALHRAVHSLVNLTLKSVVFPDIKLRGDYPGISGFLSPIDGHRPFWLDMQTPTQKRASKNLSQTLMFKAQPISALMSVVSFTQTTEGDLQISIQFSTERLPEKKQDAVKSYFDDNGIIRDVTKLYDVTSKNLEELQILFKIFADNNDVDRIYLNALAKRIEGLKAPQ